MHKGLHDASTNGRTCERPLSRPRRGQTMPKLSDMELADLAMCCRIGARLAREDAARATSQDTRAIHERTAEHRERMAERLERARKQRQG
jgi:hypothetical protein